MAKKEIVVKPSNTCKADVAKLPEHHCPKCNSDYRGFPAISRTDNKTEICPKCGEDEALRNVIDKDGHDWFLVRTAAFHGFIPVHPDQVYKDKWQGWEDYLGMELTDEEKEHFTKVGIEDYTRNRLQQTSGH